MSRKLERRVQGASRGRADAGAHARLTRDAGQASFPYGELANQPRTGVRRLGFRSLSSAVAEAQLDPAAEKRRYKRQLSEEAKRRVNRRTRKRHNVNIKLYSEVAAASVAHEIQRAPGLSTADLLTQVRDRAYFHWRYACEQVDKLRPDEFWVRKVDANDNILVEPHRWLKYERDCRLDLQDLGVKLTGIDHDERLVAVEERRALALSAYVVAVVGDLKLTAAQKKLLRPALEAHAEIIEGRAEEIA